MMKYANQYIKTAINFIDDYDGSVPLSHYLKGEFAAEKKYGSKDRRFISHLCYSYFRLGHFLKGGDAEQRIKVVLFLSSDEDWKEIFGDEWVLMWDKTIEEKIAFIEAKYQQSISSIFPWQEELSNEVDREPFILSHLHQPNLFIRVRPGKEAVVKSKLSKANVPFNQVNNNCLAFENATKLEDVLELNKEYVVQDVSSQEVGQLLSAINRQPSCSVWDCCAASGGKAIMAYDLIPNIQLTVSDIRQSIIHNLTKRFLQTNITKYNSLVADLTQPNSSIPHSPFDLVICDAPCSGSGTWSRTPEQLYFFKEAEIRRYSDLQKRIVSNVIPSIKGGGHLLYITCSVFKQENEEVVNFIKDQFNFSLVRSELLKGHDKKGDTMFAALFTTSKA